MTRFDQVADAMRLEDATMRRAAVLPWRLLGETDRWRWRRIAQAGCEAMERQLADLTFVEWLQQTNKPVDGNAE